VFETTVLRCIRGVTRRDRRRNVDIQKNLGVTHDVVNEIQHRRLSYFAHVAVPCAQPFTLRQSVGYKTTRATKEEMAGRFARGFQDCRHHRM